MINAQEAYSRSLQNLKEVDVTDILIMASNKVEEAINNGGLATYVGPITDFKVAEKAAIELQNNYNYTAGVISGQAIPQQDGSLKPTCYIQLNWKFLPMNTRESYN